MLDRYDEAIQTCPCEKLEKALPYMARLMSYELAVVSVESASFDGACRRVQSVLLLLPVLRRRTSNGREAAQVYPRYF